jgi:hypothetical protein
MVRMANLRWHRGRRRQALMRLREKHFGTETARAPKTHELDQRRSANEARLSD